MRVFVLGGTGVIGRGLIPGAAGEPVAVERAVFLLREVFGYGYDLGTPSEAFTRFPETG
jgi:hypothetical protein